MLCAISGKTPEEPVVSTKSGHVYEKRLILKYLEANNNTDPVTGQQIEPTDLIDVKVNKVIPPRPTTATSLPALLSIFQNEWDAIMLETYNLKQQLDSVRQELSHSLYQHDAACRVIARLIKERDDARNMLANLKASYPGTHVESGNTGNSGNAESMEVESGLSENIKNILIAKSTELAKERKKRTVSEKLSSVDDLKSFDVINSINLHKTTNPGISCVAIHPANPNLVITGGNDSEIIIFNVKENKINKTYTGHSKKITDIKQHPTKEIFISSSNDKTVKIWNSSNTGNTKQSENTIKIHTGDVTAIDLHATHDYVVSASVDKSWAFSDIYNGQTLSHIHSDSAINAISFHPDGLIVGSGNYEGAVKIWDIKTQKNVATFEGHKGKIADISFSENGYYLATTAEDNTVKLWDLRKLKNIQSVNLPEDFNVTSLEFDYSGTYLAVSGNDVRVFIGKTLQHVTTYSKHSSIVNDVTWGPDANSLFSVSLDRSLKIWSKK